MSSLMLLKSVRLAKQQSSPLGVLCLQSVNYSNNEIRPLKTVNLASLKRGTGGRSSFNGIVATVFGNSGFLGRYVCNKLGKIGTQMILPYRGDFSDVARLKVTGDLGQVLFHFFNLRDEDSIRQAIKYSNVVINLIGREHETKNFPFNSVHVDGARLIAKLCREAGVERLIHVSALNCDPNPPAFIMKGGSGFLRSKFHGECAVLEEFPDATIFRPSDMYGQEDRFLKYYSHIWRRQFRSMPLWKKGEYTIKQPVCVSDVAQGILNSLKDPDSVGKIYQAVGPERYCLSELVDWFHKLMRKDAQWWGYRRYDMRYDPTFFLKTKLTEFISPNIPVGNLCMPRVERECITDKVMTGLPTLEDLGVTLTRMEHQVPWELRPHRAALYYDAELGEFETPCPPKPVAPAHAQCH